MKVRDFCDSEVAGGFAVILAIAIGAVCFAAFLGGFVVSRIDCEFRPTSERCTVLYERERSS